MRTCREELGDTGGVEASLGETESSSQTGTTSTNNQGIVFVVNDGVLVAEERRSLLCAKGLVCDDTGGGGAAREGASLLSSKALRELAMLLSVISFRRPFSSWTHPRRSTKLSQTERTHDCDCELREADSKTAAGQTGQDRRGERCRRDSDGKGSVCGLGGRRGKVVESLRSFESSS